MPAMLLSRAVSRTPASGCTNYLCMHACMQLSLYYCCLHPSFSFFLLILFSRLELFLLELCCIGMYGGTGNESSSKIELSR